MSMSSRLFLLSGDDTLHQLASAAFMRMLRQEDMARIPDFASQRVRQASLVVELVDRVPLRVLHRTFSVLDIGADGRLNLARLNNQQIARMGDPLAPVIHGPSKDAPVVDATSRFIARGGSWVPDAPLLRRIEASALGLLACGRVRVVR